MRRILNTIKNHRNWWDYYLFKYINRSEDHFSFHTRGNLHIDVPRRLLHTYKESFFDESYLKGIPTNHKISKNPVVVDIGANVGYFSMFMFHKYPASRIFAYEPMPVNFELLRQYREENKSLDFNIFNLAVSSSVENLILHYDASDTFTTAATTFTKREQTDQISVSSTTLEHVMEDNNLERIDFLKLDCEGSEYEILYSAPKAIMGSIDTIALETHKSTNPRENVENLTDYIQDRGFRTRVWRDLIWAWRDS